MKKYLGILIVVLLILTTAFAACTDPTPGPGPTPTDPSKLATPVVTIDANGLASWVAVPNADSYNYKIDGGAEVNTKELSVQLTDGQSISVQAVVGASDTEHKSSDYSQAKTYTFVDTTVYGMPVPAEGFYMRDAEVLQESDTVRYLVYITNVESGEQVNVIAIARGELTEKGWVYAEGKTILEPSVSGWDLNLGSASIVKGAFSYGGESYSYLMAYCATKNLENDVAYSIGFAVAKEIDGEYVRVGTAPVIEYNIAEHGENAAGAYAPSLVNKDKQSSIGLFYTYANAYGHFLYFANADLSNLDSVALAGSVVTNKGDLSGGDAVQMMPNMDVALGADGYLYAVKDVSPTAATVPYYANSFEYAKIALEELGTTDEGEGWVSIITRNVVQLECTRAYAPCLVSDMYGFALANAEIIYNVCDDQASNADYIFSQRFASYTAPQA